MWHKTNSNVSGDRRLRSMWLMRLITACLCLGAATSVGVAWGIVIFNPNGPSSNAIAGPCCHRDGFSYRRLESHPGMSRFIARNYEWEACNSFKIEWYDFDSIPTWLESHHAALRKYIDAEVFASVHANVAGFPFWCVRSERWSAFDVTRENAGTIVRQGAEYALQLDISWLPDPAPQTTARLGLRRDLPIRVQPIGMTANTAIYAAGWFLLLVAPRGVRRWRRSRRGLCMNCAYDLCGVHDNCCPECGATLIHNESINRK